ncbi:MAG: DinB family protein [Cytophagaceae bacterium]
MAQADLKTHLIKNLSTSHAHISLEDALKDIRHELLGKEVPGIPYTIWQLTEHIRITQWDIVEFSKNPHHVSPKWPEEYWPSKKSPSSFEEFEKSVRVLQSDRDSFIELLANPDTDLLKIFEHGTGQNLLKEALLIIDHTSYHTGQIIVLRRLLNDWK